MWRITKTGTVAVSRPTGTLPERDGQDQSDGFPWILHVFSSILVLLTLLVCVISGCSSEEKDAVHEDVACENVIGHAVRVEYKVQELIYEPYTTINLDIIRRGDNIPASVKRAYNDVGLEFCWYSSTPWRWQRGDGQTFITLQDIKLLWDEIGDPELRQLGWYLVVASTRLADSDGGIIPGQLGMSACTEQPGLPSGEKWSFVFWSSIKSSYVTTTHTWETEFGSKVYDWVAAHELGHVVGGLMEPDEPGKAAEHVDPTKDRSYNWCMMWGGSLRIAPIDPNWPSNSPNLHSVITELSFCRDQDGEDQSTCAAYLGTVIP
ncbi:MAG TPA: hypothetical protein VM118_05675 [Acidobacteriota bacterium]|nr:hypothetical protein [Acidobacteriota bacterium]